MNSKQEILKKLEQQYELERLAKVTYDKYLTQIDDASICKVIKGIRDDEVDHMNICKEMISLIEQYTEKVVVKEEKAGPLEKGWKGANALILLSGIEKYMYQIVRFIKGLTSKNFLYISYNKLPKFTKQVLQEHNINLSKVLFVNCVGGGGSSEDINLKPESLTTLALTISQFSEKAKNIVVVVDNISSFTTYHPAKTIAQFVSSVNDKAREKGYVILWVAIDSPNDRDLNQKLASLCDKVIRL